MKTEIMNFNKNKGEYMEGLEIGKEKETIYSYHNLKS